MQRFQILRRRVGEKAYSLVAHGARYDEQPAREIKRDGEARGDTVRLVPLPAKWDKEAKA